MLNVVDEFTRECLCIRVGRKLKAADVIDVLADLFITRGTPGHIRSDNDPELAAVAVKGWITGVRASAAYIEPGSPWENGHVESFNGKLRDELLRRTVQRLTNEGIIETTLLGRAERQRGGDRLVKLVAGIKAAAPDRTLQQIAAQLEAMRERTPRGGTRWHASSVKHLLGKGQRLGLMVGAPGHVELDSWS